MKLYTNLYIIIFRRVELSSFSLVIGLCFFSFFIMPVQADSSPNIPPPLAVQVQIILGVPSGNAEYLPEYRTVIKFFDTHVGLTYPQFDIALQNDSVVKNALEELVWALNTGADVDTLRQKILSVIGLHEAYILPTGQIWQYGNNTDRLFRLPFHYLFIKTTNFVDSGDMYDAARYIRASMLLQLQAGVVLGGATWLKSYIGSDTYSPPPEIIKALNLTTTQVGQLKTLMNNAGNDWQISEHLISDLSQKARIIEDDRVNSTPQTDINAYVISMHNAIQKTQGKLVDQFAVLGSMQDDRRAIIASYHHDAAEAIKAALLTWAEQVKKESDISEIDRQALLRWIDEAAQ
ncbi:MAG TPA: hypothetical protein VMG59_10430 [Phycisphaerae bacterium]|nr:hypothetical protein [Phycisphaerae bacterium]